MVNRTVEITEGDVLIGEQSVRDREPAQLRREIGYVIQQIGLFPHRTIGENIGAVPQLLGWKKERIRARSAELLELIGLDPELGDRYPGPALRRPAAARRRRPGAGRRPAGDADGRAIRGDRPDQPRAPAERVPPPPGGDPQDGPLRHPRHRRGDQDGRPDRGDARGRQGRAVRDPGRAADGAGQRVRRGLRRRRPGAEAAGADAGPRHQPLGGAAGPRRPGDRPRCGRSSTRPTSKSAYPLLVDSERRPLGWLSERDLAAETVPQRPTRRLGRSWSSTT